MPAICRFHPADLCVGALAAALIRLAVWVRILDAKKFRKNEEYGSARSAPACAKDRDLTL